MRNRFDNELQELKQNLIKMGTLCEKAISSAIECFDNVSVIEEVKAAEIKIDEFEHEIETKCLRLILHEQPVAKDLRSISAILKIITDLERIGDQAVDIADLSRYSKIINEHILTMAQEVVTMLSHAIDSFVKLDLELAHSTILKDDIVDSLFLKVRCDIISILKKETTSEEVAVNTLMIAKYLERIADHAVNVCEWVVFSITGVHKGESYDSYTRR